MRTGNSFTASDAVSRPSPRLGRRITSFGALPFLGFVAPLLVLPVVARAVDASLWADLLTSQAVGSVAGLLILSGWGVYGQAQVASSEVPVEQKRAIYSASVRSRLSACAYVLPLAVIVGSFIARSTEPVTSALMLISAATSGLSLAWYAVGSGRASWIAMFEIAPRLAATAAAVLVILSGGPVWSYPGLLILFTVVGLIAFHMNEFGKLIPRYRKELLPSLDARERARATAFSAIGAAYGSSPLPVASVVGIAGAGQFASADRLYRYGLFTISTLGNALQEWVLGASKAHRIKRHSNAVLMHLALGAVGGLCLGLLGHPVGALLFGSHVAPTRGVCAGYGVAFFLLSLSTPLTRNVLVASRRADVVLRSVVVSAVAGMVLMSMLGAMFGGIGIAFGAAAAEAVNLLMLAAPAVRIIYADGGRAAGRGFFRRA